MLILGIFPLYFSFIFGGNENIKRMIKLIQINYIIQNIVILNTQKSTIIIIDGQLEIKEIILISEIILSILVLIILTYCEYDKLQIIWQNIIGIILLLESNDLIITFVSLELYNITIYLLIGNTSSGLKYFILSCIFSTIFLLGLIIIYNNFGNTQLEIIKLLQYYDPFKSNLFLLLAIQFKLGLFPFHQWLPDLYDNLTGSLIIWLQIISKYALFIWLYNINYLFQSLGNYILIISILTMIISSILTISQSTLRRFLAYSSLAHQGFLFLIAHHANYSFLFYLFIYSFTLLILMIFFIYSSFNNFYFPSLLIFSLIGLPPLPGFFAKLYIIQDLILNNYLFAVQVLIIISLILTANYIYIILIGLKKTKIHSFIKLEKNSNILAIILSLLLLNIII